jgi:hypothetical protein
MIKKDFDKKLMTNQELGKKYKDFVEKYPILFISITERNMEIKEIKKMLDKIKEIQAHKISLHDADIEKGQELFDKYVPDNLKK